MKTNTVFFRLLCCLLFLSMISCEKDYLETKPDKGLLIPRSLDDLQALLDNADIMNKAAGLHTLASDDYEVTPAGLLSFRTPAERNSYFWAEDIYEGQSSSDWNIGYQQIFYANVVLASLGDIERVQANGSRWDQIRGSALFFRAMALFQLLSEFSQEYNPSTARQLMGLPIKLSAEVDEKPVRSSLFDCYQQVLSDLALAEALLPVKKEVMLTRPSRHAVYGLLARVHLLMANHGPAGGYADKALKISSALVDFNTLPIASTRPLTYAIASPEIVLPQFMISFSFASSALAGISPELVSLYEAGDLRKGIYLRDRGNGLFTFKGNFTGTSTIFTGMTNAEMLLIRAECSIRTGELANGLNDLDVLRRKRFSKTFSYVPLLAANATEALELALLERRRELVTRGMRWTDLKRLNLEPGMEKTLVRRLDNVEHKLLPGSKRYVFPIPQNEINGSGIEQNPR